MPKTFFTSDIHFGHNAILHIDGCKWNSVYEMNDDIIRRWNEVVSPNDTVWFLGDLAAIDENGNNGIATESVRHMTRLLNGHKNMVMGNHDTMSVRFYQSCGFDFVSQYPVIIDDFFILSHAPVFLTDKMPYFNIYGHVHNDVHYVTETPQSFCACLSRHNYVPVEVKAYNNYIKENSHK